jgi:hypothetical protein
MILSHWWKEQGHSWRSGNNATSDVKHTTAFNYTKFNTYGRWSPQNPKRGQMYTYKINTNTINDEALQCQRPRGGKLASTATLNALAGENFTSLTASVVKTKTLFSLTHTLSSIRIPIPLKCSGHRSSWGT